MHFRSIAYGLGLPSLRICRTDRGMHILGKFLNGGELENAGKILDDYKRTLKKGALK